MTIFCDNFIFYRVIVGDSLSLKYSRLSTLLRPNIFVSYVTLIAGIKNKKEKTTERFFPAEDERVRISDRWRSIFGEAKWNTAL